MNIRQIESNLYIAVACLMAATGLNKKEFTTAAGISYCTPYFWETRTFLPSKKTVNKLAEVFSEEFPTEIRKLEDALSAVEDLRRNERESLVDRQPSTSLRNKFENKTPYCVIGTLRRQESTTTAPRMKDLEPFQLLGCSRKTEIQCSVEHRFAGMEPVYIW